MNKAILEKEAEKLFGGATIDLKPYQDAVHTAWDLTIVPNLDKSMRFIRLTKADGMPVALNFLRKIQQNLLNLNRNGAFGIAPIEMPVDEEKIGEEIAKRMPKENLKNSYVCADCKKSFKYPGPLSMHTKTHKKPMQSVASAPNDPLIYAVKES